MLAGLAPGRVELLTRRIGYSDRRDTLTIPDHGGLRLRIELKRQWSPVVDCEIGMTAQVRQRKPWWKWW